MKFKEREEPVYTSEPHYDLLDGGYIDPEDLLEDEAQASKVRDAIILVNQFLGEAEEAGALEIG